MVAFASNSLLCRAALAGRSIDAVSFTSVRLLAGAVALLLLARGRGAGSSWRGALALAAYAFAFSLAYLRLPAGTGALILFGTVQVAMLAGGLLRGERPSPGEWAGLALALGGLVGLTRPWESSPELPGAALMVLAGLAWADYSLRGRVASPLEATAGNFARALPLVAIALAVAAVRGPAFHVSPRGTLLAAASGALASGLGYALWYRALRDLKATQAAVVQISVVPIAALGAVAFLGERLTERLATWGVVILGGIALAIATRRRKG